MAFAALSNQSELNTQIDTFIALAPIAFLNHVESPLLQFLASLDMEELLILLDFHKFYPNSETMQEMVPEVDGICISLIIVVMPIHLAMWWYICSNIWR